MCVCVCVYEGRKEGCSEQGRLQVGNDLQGEENGQLSWASEEAEDGERVRVAERAQRHARPRQLRFSWAAGGELGAGREEGGGRKPSAWSQEARADTFAKSLRT